VTATVRTEAAIHQQTNMFINEINKMVQAEVFITEAARVVAFILCEF
jgi:hypothetical protein